VIVLLSTMAVAWTIQSIALAFHLPGLSALPRKTPAAFWILCALCAAAMAIVPIWEEDLLALWGIPIGIALAVLLTLFHRLDPDDVLLHGARQLEIPGHADARAVLLLPEKPPRATVLFVHGAGNDRSFGVWHLAPQLLEHGFALVLFHLPGHGEGGADLLSAEALGARFDAVHAAARASVDAPLFAVGQSLGGATVLDAIARGVQLDGAVTVSAIRALDLRWRLLREAAVVLRNGAWRIFRYGAPLETIPAVGGFHRQRFPVRVLAGHKYLDEIRALLVQLDLANRLRQSKPAFPITVVHGVNDGIVPVAQGRELAAALGERARYLELSSLHHLDPLFDDRVIAQIIELIEARARP